MTDEADPANATRSRAVSVSSPSSGAPRRLRGRLSLHYQKGIPMQRYEITGMSCAACASHVEKAVAAVAGCGIRRRKPADQLDAGRLCPRRRPRCHRTAHPPAPWTPPGTARPYLRRAKAPSSRTPRLPSSKAPGCQPLFPCPAYVRLDGPHDRPAAGQCVPRRRLARHPVRGRSWC